MKGNKKILLALTCIFILLLVFTGITQAVIIEKKEIGSIKTCQNTDYATLIGRTVDRKGRTVKQADVYATLNSIGYVGQWCHQTESDESGYYTLQVLVTHPDIETIVYAVNSTKFIDYPGAYLKPIPTSQTIDVSDLTPGEIRELPDLVLPVDIRFSKNNADFLLSMILQRISTLFIF